MGEVLQQVMRPGSHNLLRWKVDQEAYTHWLRKAARNRIIVDHLGKEGLLFTPTLHTSQRCSFTGAAQEWGGTPVPRSPPRDDVGAIGLFIAESGERPCRVAVEGASLAPRVRVSLEACRGADASSMPRPPLLPQPYAQQPSELSTPRRTTQDNTRMFRGSCRLRESRDFANVKLLPWCVRGSCTQEQSASESKSARSHSSSTAPALCIRIHTHTYIHL